MSIYKTYQKQFFVVILLFVACAAAACPNPNGNTNKNAENRQPVNSSGGQSAPAANAAEPTKSSLPQSKALDLQTNHANGSVLRVTRVDFADDSIALEFAVTNGYNFPIKLAQGKLQLRDDLGNVYNLSPPAQNPDIEIAPNNNLKGKLTFLGRIAPTAKSLTVTTNYQYSSSTGGYDRTPYMVISNIPVER